jgi:mono/diheme cytochrome c family protein
MWKSALVGALVAGVIIVAFLAVCGPESCRLTQVPIGLAPVTTEKSPARKTYYLRNGVPSAYRGKKNPFQATIGNVVEGARLYDLRCAVCHGMMGIGDGEGGEKLDYPPADLGSSLADPLNNDDFFFWTIADGGAPFGTDMPPYRNDLKEAEIWKIVVFMRAAFAESGEKPPAPQ